MRSSTRFQGAVLLAAVTATLAAAGPPAAGDGKPNRLINERSPYLLQHAYNPVEWYPWGPEAFAAAREQDKPIFLSIGYSTCYWCHVMERESFEVDAIAALMNADFISIKVDREQRPDVDAIYMAAVQAIAGRGGWPMSVFLDPRTLEPFEGGTYFPPQPRYNKPSFPQLLKTVADRWATDRDGVTRRAAEIAANARRKLTASSRPVSVSQAEVNRAVTSILSGYDRVNAGFRRSRTKFPLPAQIELLFAAAWDDTTAREAVLHTLDRMAMGGIYDQVGGGFHRYSTDARWLVPHFEKMLYDNAQLARVYTRAYGLTGDEFYAEVARETLDYVLREMTGLRYGFFSAQDAEVDAREGASYVWTPATVSEAVTFGGLEQHVEFALDVYGLNRGTNFQDPHHRDEGPTNVLYLADRPDVTAERMDMTLDDFNALLGWVNEAMLLARDEREQPHLDDKVLTEWNGLMIVAFVEAAQTLSEPKYLKAAERAAAFLLARMRTHDGWLARTWRADIAEIPAFSSDYAQFIAGLIALHRSTITADRNVQSKWLLSARRLADEAKTLFLDSQTGTYFDTRATQTDLFVRPKSMRDGVVPSANSTMILNLLDLHELTGEASYLDDAAATLAGISSRLRANPASLPLGTIGLKRFVDSYPDRLGGAVTVTRQPAVVQPAFDPVTVEVSAETVSVAAGIPGSFEITLNIDDGYHVNANKPGTTLLTGLDIRLVGRGLDLAAQYPPGEAFRTAGFDEAIQVYSGSVTIPLTVTQRAVWSGTPRIVMTYQVCTDQVCLRPKRIILPLRVVH